MCVASWYYNLLASKFREIKIQEAYSFINDLLYKTIHYNVQVFIFCQIYSCRPGKHKAISRNACRGVREVIGFAGWVRHNTIDCDSIGSTGFTSPGPTSINPSDTSFYSTI